MTLNYHKVWDSLNELESVTSKICSARAILNTAMNAHEVGRREETETLMYAVDEFLQYYLEEFDRKFKIAWQETVVKLNPEEIRWEYEMPKKEENKKWIIPIEVDGPSGEYYIVFPDDLLEAANIQENDVVEWEDNGDGSYLLKKVEKKTLNHDEAIKEGWSMTDDGFWIKE